MGASDMRTLVISDVSRRLLAGHILSRSISISHQLADKSWEALIDDDLGFMMDCLCGDPDRAIAIVCKADWGWCYRCQAEVPLIDDGETCGHCKLVL